jgi:hypothetical protein
MDYFEHGDAVFSRTGQRRFEFGVSLIASRKSLFEIDHPYACWHDLGALAPVLLYLLAQPQVESANRKRENVASPTVFKAKTSENKVVWSFNQD